MTTTKIGSIHRMTTMPDNPTSILYRTSHKGGRESKLKIVIKADDMSIRTATDGTLVLEFLQYDANGRAVEGFQVHVCPEDEERIKQEVNHR